MNESPKLSRTVIQAKAIHGLMHFIDDRDLMSAIRHYSELATKNPTDHDTKAALMVLLAIRRLKNCPGIGSESPFGY